MTRREFLVIIGGAGTAWPLALRAQQSPMPVIGFLSARSPDESADLIKAFAAGLKDDGFIEGQNVAIESRSAQGD